MGHVQKPATQGPSCVWKAAWYSMAVVFNSTDIAWWFSLLLASILFIFSTAQHYCQAEVLQPAGPDKAACMLPSSLVDVVSAGI